MLNAIGKIIKGTGSALFSNNTAARTATWSGVGAGAGFLSSDANSPTNKFYDTLRGAALGGSASLLASGGISALKRSPQLLNTRGIKNARTLRNIDGPRGPGGRLYGVGQIGPSMKTGAFTSQENQAMSYMHQLKTSPLGSVTRGAMSGVASAGKFIAKHPYATAGAVGVGMLAANPLGTAGGSMQPRSSPTMSGAKVNIKYNEQEIMSEQMQSGVAPVGQYGSASQMMNSWHKAMQSSTAGLVQGLHKGRHG